MERERDLSSAGSCPKCINSHDEVRLRPGAWNPVQVWMAGIQVPDPSAAAYQGACSQEAWSEVEEALHPPHSTVGCWDAGIPSLQGVSSTWSFQENCFLLYSLGESTACWCWGLQVLTLFTRCHCHWWYHHID